jgi:transposase
MESRKLRALKIVETGAVCPDPDPERENWWLVPSQTGVGGYHVHLPTDGRAPTCTCKDFEKPEVHFCKHIFAAEMANGRLFVDPVKAKKKGEYVDDRDWAAVNAAHINEKDQVLRLAHELCRGIVEPPQERGRPRVPLHDLVFAAQIWVYGTKSGRDAMHDFKIAQEKGLVSRKLHWGSLMRHLQNPELTPLLRTLLRETALPMRHIERRFAVDATGFSTKIWHRWYDHKWGKAQEEKIWLKAHAICGVDTMIVTDCVIADVGDATKFPELVQHTYEHFLVEEVTADGAYASKANVELVGKLGASPFIPVEDRVRDNHGPQHWRKMVALFRLQEDEFRAHYHQRSKIETVFSMVKRKFDGSVRGKHRVVQQNEILCKFILHNFRVVIMGLYARGEQPTFLKEAV